MKSGQTNEKQEVVNVIPTTLLDTCGEEHHINISVKCSGLNDVVQTTIESRCTALAPEIPICNETDLGISIWLSYICVRAEILIRMPKIICNCEMIAHKFR